MRMSGVPPRAASLLVKPERRLLRLAYSPPSFVERFSLGISFHSVDLTRRREPKPEVGLKIVSSVRVECAGQIQPVVLDAID
jgi:hypothetical protein